MILNPWKEIKRLRDQAELLKSAQMDLVRELHRVLDRADKMHIALRAIADEERETSNATVKRMARLAREGVAQ
jgi:hypothetical protein